MKKVVFCGLFAASLLKADIPNDVKIYLDSNFPGSSVVESSLIDGNLKVILSDDLEIIFDKDNKVKDVYKSKKDIRREIRALEREKERLEDEIYRLERDKRRAYKNDRYDDDDDYDDDDNRRDNSKFGNLPPKIKKEITRRYPNARVVDVEYDDDEIEVELSNGVEMEFSRSGRLLEIDD